MIIILLSANELFENVLQTISISRNQHLLGRQKWQLSFSLFVQIATKNSHFQEGYAIIL